MKPVGIKSNTYHNISKKNNKLGTKFEISYRVRISKYKNIFAKGYIPNWSKEIFMIK